MQNCIYYSRSTNKGFGKFDSPFKYSDIVYGLTNGVLNKIQYQCNHAELNDLDTEVHENEVMKNNLNLFSIVLLIKMITFS